MASRLSMLFVVSQATRPGGDISCGLNCFIECVNVNVECYCVVTRSVGDRRTCSTKNDQVPATVVAVW